MNATGAESGPAVAPPFMAPPLALTSKEFATIAALARDEFGLELGHGKEQLVASRLAKLMRQRSYTAFRDYYRYVEGDRTGEALVELIDALTTNHTSFFREPAHFDFLVQRVFADHDGRGPLRIWSAASSTGEEPYTIALTAREHLLSNCARPGRTTEPGVVAEFPDAAGRAARAPGAQSRALPRILATDISARVLETARKGLYKAERFEAGPAPWLRKHLLRGEGRWQGWYRMRPEILEMVEFHRLNLIEPLPDVGRFAVIFCRNVMIYFSRETQEGLVNRLAACLEPGGYLFVGHSESLTGIQHPLQQIQPAIYRKRGGKK